MRFNSFDEVVKWYNATKPMVSKNHTKEHDVRPIGSRNRKWERIKKVNDSMYALCDGNYGNTIWGNVDPQMQAYENMMAPIMWIREGGADYIRIRNHSDRACSVTRYKFLAYHLPSNIKFDYNQQGKHWVEVCERNEAGMTEWVKYPLPKAPVRFDYQTKKYTHDDKTFLMFRDNKDGTFTRVGDKLKTYTQRIDKAVKERYKKPMEEFYEYCAAMAPLIQTDWNARRDYMEIVIKYALERGIATPHGWLRRVRDVPSELVRAAVLDPQHPLRVAVAALTISEIDGKREIKSEADLRYIKSAYNRAMNHGLNLYMEFEV